MSVGARHAVPLLVMKFYWNMADALCYPVLISKQM